MQPLLSLVILCSKTDCNNNEVAAMQDAMKDRHMHDAPTMQGNAGVPLARG